MPAFKFKLAEHVTIPTLGVPGRVYRRIDTAGAENTYFLVYLNEICGPALLDRAVSESELIAAQPALVAPAPVTTAEVRAAAGLPDISFTNETPAVPKLKLREAYARKRSRSKRRS